MLSSEAINLRSVAVDHQRILGDGAIGARLLNIVGDRKFVSRPFDEVGIVALPPVGSEAVVLSWIVPKGFDAIVKRYSIGCAFVGFVEGSGDIVWRMEIDGMTIPNFDRILTQRGSLENPRVIDDLVVNSGQQIRVIVNHANNVGLNGDVVASLSGRVESRVR